MGTENDNNFETVIIDGQLWAVTSTGDGETPEQETVSVPDDLADQTEDAQGVIPEESNSAGASEPDNPDEQAEEVQSTPIDGAEPADEGESATQSTGSEDESLLAEPTVAAATDEAEGGEQTGPSTEPEFDSLRALTSLLVGGAIEGTSQLITRLREYEEQLRLEAAESSDADGVDAASDEDELVRFRYALVGLIFDAQATFRRNVTLWAKLAEKSTSVTNQITEPVTNSFLFRPARRRYQSLVRRGEESLARWIAEGRVQEPPSRQLASRTYVELVDEFIDTLAENPELQALITEQSIGVASDMRDEVRERTVTADNVMESLVRRILRRTPRAELPEPPPEVQRWAGLSLEEAKKIQESDEATD